MNRKAIEQTELNKILQLTAEYAVLDDAKEKLKIPFRVRIFRR